MKYAYIRTGNIIYNADDIDVIGRTPSEVIDKFLAIKKATKSVGLRVNGSKTKLMITSHGDSIIDHTYQSYKTKEIRDSESPTHETNSNSNCNSNYKSQNQQHLPTIICRRRCRRRQQCQHQTSLVGIFKLHPKSVQTAKRTRMSCMRQLKRLILHDMTVWFDLGSHETWFLLAIVSRLPRTNHGVMSRRIGLCKILLKNVFL
uniref:Reverse transcriptase domain-containing protein n=1 Tax=Megaselia scalaris TaxID=36166 RepID=T1GPP0_MEGSC